MMLTKRGYELIYPEAWQVLLARVQTWAKRCVEGQMMLEELEQAMADSPTATKEMSNQ